MIAVMNSENIPLNIPAEPATYVLNTVIILGSLLLCAIL